MHGCSQKENNPGSVKYKESINKWHAIRIERLKQPDSWLSLAGLYWLKEGKNTIGLSSDNDIQFPDNAAAHLGTIMLENKEVYYHNDINADVLHDSIIVRKIKMEPDISGNPTVLKHGSLSWYLIVRGERFGIRLKDSQHPAFKKFKGIDRYKVNLAWRIPAKFVPYDPPKPIMIPNVLGTTEESFCHGALEFELQGEKHQLDPLGEPGAKQLFIIFSDMTSGKETYGAGRFLYVDAPDENGNTFIDFNKAYNPPCAFTEYATCPLPPRQNWLTISVTAGEKDYHIMNEH